MDSKLQSLLYEESLYTIQHQWKSNNERDDNLKKLLNKVFAEAQHADLARKVQSAKLPVHLLKVIVEEPTNLHYKTTSTSSCTAHLVPKPAVGRRGSGPSVQDAEGTCTVDSPRQPSSPMDPVPHRAWRQAFKLDLTHERDKELLLNFWKKCEGSLRESKKRHSSTMIPLSSMDRPATTICYVLQKKKNGRWTDKGNCAVSTTYTTKLRDTTLSRDAAFQSLQVYELLLHALAEWEHSQQPNPLWDGKLSEEARYLLLLYECQVDLPASQTLARRWSCYMKEHNKKPLDIKCFKSLFTESLNNWTDTTQSDEVKEVLLEFTKQRLASLQKLGQHFPASSTNAVKQLSETLWLLQQINISKIINGSTSSLMESVEWEITEGANVWYLSKRKTFDTFRHQKKDFMQAMATLCTLIDKELSAMEKHHSVFQRTMYLNYRAVWCKEIEGMLAEDIRTSMEETQTRWEKADDSVEERCRKEKDMASAMHSLYISLQTLNNRLDRSLKDQPLPLATFHDWFLGGINSWAKTVQWKTESIIKNALRKETLQWDHPAARHSSSAHDLLSWFVAMRDFWAALAWPDPDITNILVCGLIQEICDASILYVTLMRERLVAEGLGGGNIFVLSNKICVGLCSVHHLQASLPALLASLVRGPRAAGAAYSSTSSSTSSSVDGRVAAPAAAVAPASPKADPSTVLDSGIDDLNKQMVDTLRTMAENTMPYIKSHLEAIASDAAVQTEDDSIFEYYDNNLRQLFEGLSENTETFKTFLYMLWETVLRAFSEELQKNRISAGFVRDRKSGHSSAYYPRMHTMLQKLLQVFKVDVVGIKIESLQNDVYKVLQEQLELRQKSTAELVNLHHQETANRQLSVEEQTHGTLNVECCYDAEKGALVVQLLSVSGLPEGSPQKIQVKLHLCLKELFSKSKALTSKTVTCVGGGSGTFNETFLFALSKEQRLCRDSLLVLELWRVRVLAGRLLGEAVVELGRATGAASGGASNASVRVALLLQSPKVNAESQVLQILKSRRDPEARNFIKKMLKRDRS